MYRIDVLTAMTDITGQLMSRGTIVMDKDMIHSPNTLIDFTSMINFMPLDSIHGYLFS